MIEEIILKEINKADKAINEKITKHWNPAIQKMLS